MYLTGDSTVSKKTLLSVDELLTLRSLPTNAMNFGASLNQPLRRKKLKRFSSNVYVNCSGTRFPVRFPSLVNDRTIDRRRFRRRSLSDRIDDERVRSVPLELGSLPDGLA